MDCRGCVDMWIVACGCVDIWLACCECVDILAYCDCVDIWSVVAVSILGLLAVNASLDIWLDVAASTMAWCGYVDILPMVASIFGLGGLRRYMAGGCVDI